MLVEEDDGHFAEAEADGVENGTAEINAPKVGEFGKVEGPVVDKVAVVTFEDAHDELANEDGLLFCVSWIISAC